MDNIKYSIVWYIYIRIHKYMYICSCAIVYMCNTRKERCYTR